MTTVGVIGLGLIGGSVALAAKRAGHSVLAWDADPETRAAALAGGLTVSTDLTDADVVVVAVHLPALSEGLATTLSGVHVSATATLTDVGSLKQPVAAAMRAAGLTQRYVGGHPMTGSEHAGFTSATADLFAGTRWVLCLDPDDDIWRWLRVAALITDLGAGVLALTPAEHDATMALISGVPHLLALALSAAAAGSGPATQQLAAGSFADLTRVAASSPTLLHALTVQNAPAVRTALRLVLDQLDGPWTDLIEDGHAARVPAHDGPRRDASSEANSPETAQTTVTDARSLLDLGRVGTVVESVDANGMVIHYRPPPSS